MTKQTVYIIAAGVVAVIVLTAGFMTWLDSHDRDVRARANAEFELNSLRQQVSDLKAEREQIKQDTAAKIAAEDESRKQATTPEKQIEYVTVRVPGVTPKQDEVNGAPVISFPAQQLPNLADYVNQAEDAKKALTGCKAEVANLDLQVKADEKQIAVLQGEKKRGRFGTFVKGMGTGGAIVGAIAIKFLLF